MILRNCGTPMDTSNDDFEVSSKNLEANVGGELEQPHEEVSSMSELPHLDEINTKQVDVEEVMLPSMDELIEEDSRIQEKKKKEVEGSMLELVEFQEIEPNKVDTGVAFISEEIFKSEEAAVAWLTNTGKMVGVVLVRARSDYSQGRNPYVKYTCERSGSHRDTRKGYVKKTTGKGKGKPRASSTKKCGCEFLILLKKDRKVDGWRVTVKNGFHNHSLNISTLGHSYLGRLREDEKELLCRLSKSGAKPKVIQQELKDLNPNNCTSVQTIYNERVKLKKAMRDNQTVIQEVIHQEMDSLPRTCVHNHWKTLSMDDPLKDEVVDPSPYINDFLQVFNASTVTQQFELIQRLREVTEPGATRLSQPATFQWEKDIRNAEMEEV